jgi:hypothetical protein
MVQIQTTPKINCSNPDNKTNGSNPDQKTNGSNPDTKKQWFKSRQHPKSIVQSQTTKPMVQIRTAKNNISNPENNKQWFKSRQQKTNQTSTGFH